MLQNKVFTFLIVLFFYVSVDASNSTFISQLKALKGVDVKEVKADSMYQSGYLIMFSQPIDHTNPAAGSFKQRIWLSHLDENAPMVMVTEGYYANRNYTTELAKYLKANQLIVEHRYFAESTPENKNWKYLTIAQAAADHHAIIQLFKTIYKGKWLTTGVSKGGQTTIFHRALYPDDVDVSVPYVAPINLKREDSRLLSFFKHVGKASDRKKIAAFQRLVLQKKEELMPKFIELSKKNNWTFSMGYEKAYEMAVLEYPFAFWQWGRSVDEIPTESNGNDEILKNFVKDADPGYFSDQTMKIFEPFFYQAFKELGYYNYVPGDLLPLMNAVKADTIHNDIFAPGGDTLKYNAATIMHVTEELRIHNPKMILIYGENDPWGATSLNVRKMSNAVKVIEKGGSHLARIYNLPPKEREKIIALLKEWMN